jgi:hypothetical protein
MRVSGYLLPFPDPGAADLMSDHLEQDVHAAGPGTLRLRVSLPGTLVDEAGSPAQTGTRFARTKLEVLQAAADGWTVLWSATSAGDQGVEEVALDVRSAGTVKGRLTNLSGMEGQFTLDCTFVPRPAPEAMPPC